MKTQKLPSKADLVGLFSYDPLTGFLTHARPGVRNGERAGSDHWRANGDRASRRVTVHGTSYLEHRIIWQLFYGSIPEGMVIDHINGDPFDNRLANLRCATHHQNMLNRKLHKNSTTGYPGVYNAGNGRFRARATINGNVIGLGTFPTIEQAIAARQEATDAHGELTRSHASPRVPPTRESQRCPTCGHLPRVLTSEQIAKGRERAHRQWLRRKELIAKALGKSHT